MVGTYIGPKVRMPEPDGCTLTLLAPSDVDSGEELFQAPGSLWDGHHCFIVRTSPVSFKFKMSILFHSMLFCTTAVLFYCIRFCSILFWSVLLYYSLFCSTMFFSLAVLPCPISEFLTGLRACCDSSGFYRMDVSRGLEV